MARLKILDSTKKQLFAACRGACTICRMELFRTVGGQPLQLGEIAHICAANATGPRHNPTIDDEARRAFDNLMVLCPSCHIEVDAASSHYTIERLREIKRTCESGWTGSHGNDDAAALQLREHPPITMVLVFSAEGSSRSYAAKRRYDGPAPLLAPGTPYRLEELGQDLVVRTPRVTATGIEIWFETLHLPDADSFPDIHLRERLRTTGWEILQGWEIDAPEERGTQ